MASTTPPALDKLSELAKAKAFLGRDFLTWLWFQAESQSEALSLQTEQHGTLSLRLWVDDRLILDAHDVGTHAMRGGRPTQSLEAAIGLGSGKRVSGLKVGFDIDGVGAFVASLDHRDLTPRSLRLPSDDPDQIAAMPQAGESPLARRIYFTTVFVACFDALFQCFLDERCAPQWIKAGAEPISSWIAHRYEKALVGKGHAPIEAEVFH